MTAVTTDPSVIRESSRLSYIPALDGIRAIAVLLVMSYHFGQSWLPGGFIGVDIFFVLSGFLITTLLVERSPEPLGLIGFWLRRGRRLFPALSLLLVVVCLYALTTPALEQLTIRGQGLATLFYVNNWWLIHTGVSYFDAYQNPSPLLHTWSLSVEEQWYVVFPLLLGLLVLARRFRPGHILGLCVGLGLLSFGWTVALALNGASPDRLYLSTDTRAQELLAGAVLGVLGVSWARRHGSRTGVVTRAWLGASGWIGMAGLLVMALIWRERSLVAVQLPLAALLSALLILGALAPGARLAVLLSWEPLRRIGVISYGLYLWHWPVTVIFDSQSTNAATPVRLIVTFAVACASYFALERPIRRWPLRRVGKLLLILPLPLALLLFLCTPKAPQASTLRGLPEQAAFEYHGSGPKVFFVGDSVGGSLWQPAWLRPRNDIAVTGSLLLGCPAVNLTFLLPSGEQTEAGPPPGTSCETWLEQWRLDVQRLKPDILLMVTSSQLQFDATDGGPLQPFGTPGYEELLFGELDRSFAGLGVPHIVIATPPCTDLGSNPINDAKNDRRRTYWLQTELKKYAQMRGYGVVDLTARTCNEDTAALYMDGIHFTPETAAQTWDWMAPQLLGQLPGAGRSQTPAPSTSPSGAP